ncbi:pilus assembly protein TadG-related protein [Myceligenerans crystallogenes]|uniref:Putative Flp pilus-assembly TadG-like N-terminal domain-containing protein n=1 Tax=Myceligenerans crystallogenes TaxID=316335 RepID=A0ABN2N3L9_9MICO
MLPRDDRRPRHDDAAERGSLHVLTIPVTVAFVSVAVLVIAMVGTATNDRRQSGAAADAAALAAAQEWDDQLHVLTSLHLGAGDAAGFWGLLDAPLAPFDAEDEMRAAAQEYAEANGAELTGLDIDPETLEVTATVRHDEVVPDTGVHAEASATARIRLAGGLCVESGSLGWLLEDGCVIEPPEEDEENEEDDAAGEDPDPETPEDTEEEPEPEWTAPAVVAYRSDVVLSE